MAASQVQVLRELGGPWLQCQDAQGVYYYNQVTKQSFDDVPAELRTVTTSPQATSPQTQTQVLRELGGGWLQCKDDQGVFFFNQVTQQASVDVPAELRAPAPAPASAQPQNVGLTYVQQPQVPQVAPASEPKIKEQIGDWMICEDAQGEYYFNARSQQSFDQAPAELVQLYQLAQQQKQAAAKQAAAKQQQQQRLAQQQQQQQLLQQQMQYQLAPQMTGSANQYYQPQYR